MSVAFAMVILICVLMIFDFFGTKLTKEKVQHNEEYADAYKTALNTYLKDGYVPLQRLLYFYLEDSTLTLDILYTMNQNKEAKTAREIESVCEDQRVKNMTACTNVNIEENKDYLVVSTGHFNFPLKSEFTVTSFFNEQRTVYGESNTHNGWDLAVPAQTPVYSVCDGVVEKVNFTQDSNLPYDQSGNSVGNTITLKCDSDYDETYYVIFAHLYPNSAKVKEGFYLSFGEEFEDNIIAKACHYGFKPQDDDGILTGPFREGILAYKGRKNSSFFKDSFESLVVTNDKDICTFSFCYVDKNTSTAFIEPVCTREKYRKMGLCKEMLHGTINRLKEMNIERAYINSFAWRKKVYNSAGFETEDSIGFWYKEI